MRAGVLDQFDVAIFPGGSGSKEEEAIDEVGRKAIREFVDSGGGYVGIWRVLSWQRPSMTGASHW